MAKSKTFLCIKRYKEIIILHFFCLFHATKNYEPTLFLLFFISGIVSPANDH